MYQAWVNKILRLKKGGSRPSLDPPLQMNIQQTESFLVEVHKLKGKSKPCRVKRYTVTYSKQRAQSQESANMTSTIFVTRKSWFLCIVCGLFEMCCFFHQSRRFKPPCFSYGIQARLRCEGPVAFFQSPYMMVVNLHSSLMMLTLPYNVNCPHDLHLCIHGDVF